MVEEEYEYKAPKKITTYKPKSTDNEVLHILVSTTNTPCREDPTET